MNTKHKSLRNFCLLLLSLGCTTSNLHQSSAQTEISYKRDQQQIEHLRGSIPAEIRENNNTKAYILRFFGDRHKNPNDIKIEFQKELIKKRNRAQELARKEREKFSANEKKTRDNFFAEQKKQRQDFIKNHAKDRDKIKDNYIEQDVERKEFLTRQKELREEFTAQQQANRKELDIYFKDLRDLFEEELKLYKEEFKVAETNKKQQESLQQKAKTSNPTSLRQNIDQFSPEVQKLILELDEMYKKPAEPL